jgi:predicted Zn-dependent protease
MTDVPHKSAGNFQNLLKYFGLLMVVVYIGAGVLLLLPGTQLSFLSWNSRLILGIALIAYGVFRGWRSFKSINNENLD